MITFSVDFDFCVCGNRWTFISASGLYSDLFYCKHCGCFYFPTVKKLTFKELNKEFYSDRAKELVKRAEFIEWKKTLKYKDMDKFKQLKK